MYAITISDFRDGTKASRVPVATTTIGMGMPAITNCHPVETIGATVSPARLRRNVPHAQPIPAESPSTNPSGAEA